MNLLDQISDALGATGALGDLSSTLGTSAAETDSMVSAGLPALLGGLGAQSGGDGMGALMGLLGESGGFADNIGSFFGQGDKTGLASKLVGSIFGSQRGAVESHIAGASGGAMSMASRFLPMLAPAVMGLLGKITKDDELDGEGLATRFAELESDGPLAELLGAGTDDDRAGFMDGIASLRDAGGLAALLPAAGTAGAVATKAAAAGAVATTAAGAGATTKLAGTYDDDDHDRSGLGWLPLVLLGVIGLIVGLVLWQCTSSNDSAAGHSEDAVEEVVEPEPAPEPTAEPTPEPTAEPTPEPTPEPEPTAVPAPDPVTIADLAVGSPDLSTLVAVAGQVGLAGDLADADAGPFTVFAPTNAAFADAAGVIERLDGDQTTQAVAFHVVPGVYMAADLVPGTRLETLSGDILFVDAVGGTLNGGTTIAQADLEADNGVVHIIEGVMVPSSLQRGLAAGDLNALFALEPIQFATGSAEILGESIPTLDQAVEFLTNVPAGSKFEVQGHTDSQGGEGPNQVLSEARANSVVAYLTSNGVSASLLEANGYGETQLKVDPEVTPEDFAANRRIEFVDIS